jgi:hypothetical protein
MVVSTRYSTIKKKKEAARIEYPAIWVTSFVSIVIIYKIKKSRENSFACERIY